jgi:PAS domain S-box-containing protein
VQDITERKQAEQEVALLSFALDKVREATFLIDERGRFQYVNEEACRVLGYSRAELLALGVADIDPEFPAERWSDHWRDLTVQRSMSFESWHRTRTGRIFPVEISANYFEYGGRPYILALARDITERKRAEEAHSRLAAIVESSDDAIIGKDLDGTITDWNKGAERLYGYSAAEVLGRSVSILMPPDQQDEMAVFLRSIREGIRVDHYETKRVRKDGGTIDVSLTLSPIKDNRGQIIGASTIARNITAQKRVEDALRRSEAYLAESQRMSHTGSWAINTTTGQYDYFSEELCRMYGYDPQEGLPSPKTVLQERVLEDPDGVEATWSKAFREKVDSEYEGKIMLPDGTVKHIQTILHPVLNEAGDVVQLAGTTIDITERKRAEQERYQSMERFRAIADYTYDWENWIGVDGRLLWVNPAVERITGYSVNECMAMPDFPIPIVAEPDRETVAPQMREAVQGSSRNDFEFRVRHKDGRLVWVAVSWQPIYDSRGARLGYRSSIRDISERKQAQEALQRLLAELESRVEERTKELSEANESLQAANKELESFSYSVSHDLRAPLRAIDGFSKLVLKGYADKLDDEGRRKLNVIRSNAQRMDDLINDLLAFSRLGRKEMVQASVDMEALVWGAWRELAVVNPERRIQFSVQKLPHAMGDETLIKEVVVNLLTNAIKFSRYRKKAVVEVGAYPEEERNVYFVKDNGVGFDMQYYDKLFGVFQRLHSADEFEGTGVGLAIVERIISRHGGRVWAEGKEDKGATFYFTLTRKE